MAASHVDGVNRKTWTASIMFAILTFINVTVHLIMSNFPGLGYPCTYYHVVDFNEFNMSTYNVAHQLTPQLFLDAGQVLSYAVLAELTFFLILCYYIVCWAKIFFRKDAGLNLNQTTRDITYMGDSMSCFLYILCMDTFEMLILTMSFRLPVMISFACCLHFICLSIYTITMLTQYQSYDKSSFALSRIHPALKSTVKFKTLILNLLELFLGFSTMVLAMALCLGFGNSFFVKTGHMVFATLAVFAFIMITYFIVIEAILYRYMKVQVGYHAGTFCGLCGATYTIISYENVAASAYTQNIHIVLACCMLCWLAFALCRVIRFFTAKQRRYKPLANNTVDEIKSLKLADDHE
ncbi:B100 [miniopterid betaherpesvirus 1]|uniref:B100 n=1 Tax=miniopterid betaherpesvirus 1 TaxID=3070189 RepID=I3VQ93_9BETA|nr:B100 [miniopterid betaherpesvirus 1]AFK83937.1 B100 [miniopterid betaherpesvirus 1]